MPEANSLFFASRSVLGVWCLAAAVLIGNVGCRRQTPVAPAQSQPAAPDNPVVHLGGVPITLEVAATDLARQRGLMYRKSMPPDAGMIFVFPEAQVQRFWMKDTSIPLDIVYLNASGKIVSIKQMQPFDLEGVSSDEPAKYAIELNQGTAERLKLQAGQTIELPPRITNPPELE